MTRFILIISYLICQNVNSFAQFFDDFSDSNLNSNPVWEGDVQNFLVNELAKLQLSAPEEGTSTLFTQLSMPDSIVWDFEAELDFSPSDNNQLRIYLSINDFDISTASGYFIEIGENGANDDVKFYYLNGGVEELIASGSLGAVGTEPAYTRARIQYFPDGFWKMDLAYDELGPFQDEIEFIHAEYDFSGNQIFQLTCNYTSSRRDKFYFDNIGISKFELDKTGPEIVSAMIIDGRTIEIVCNETLDPSSIEMLNNYALNPYSGSISSAELINGESGIRIGLSEPLQSGTTYTINISGIKDVSLNLSNNASFEIFLTEEASTGDLVVNEILFNPETNGFDFVEVYNVSKKFITFENISLLNAAKNELKIIGEEYILKPGNYLCLSEDIEYLKSRYLTPDSAQFLQVDIPSFNNDEGNVSIVNNISGEVIDAFDYSEELHFQELDDINGVSLERINPFGNSQSDNNWFSASSAVSFATPGYQNSVFLNPNFNREEILSFENKTFSPNQDGMDDQLIIKLVLPENGYLVDINIYDQGGRKIQTLVNNELFSTEGIVLWDGVNENGELEDIGIYFVIFEAFNGSGNVIKVKKPVILADYLD